MDIVVYQAGVILWLFQPGDGYTIGLHSDGTVVVAEDNYFVQFCLGWENIKLPE